MDEPGVWSRAGRGDVEVGIQRLPILECQRCLGRGAVCTCAMWRHGLDSSVLDDGHADFGEIFLGFLHDSWPEGRQNL